MSALSQHIADNLRSIRRARQLSQQKLADLADVPRATLAHLESGTANPTLSLLLKVSEALQVSLSALTEVPAPAILWRPLSELKSRRRGAAVVRQLLLDDYPGWGFEKVVLRPGGRWKRALRSGGGSLHLAVENGVIELEVLGQVCRLDAGDVAQVAGTQGLLARNVARREAAFYLLSLPLTPSNQ